MAVHVISVRRAFCLLCKDLAEVVSLRRRPVRHLRLRDLAGAQRVSAEPISARRTTTGSARPPVRSRCRASSGCSTTTSAQADGEVQPPQHLRPRPQPVPVLRQEVPDQRAEPRPRRAAQPGRRRRPGRTSSAPAWTATSARAAARPKQAHMSADPQAGEAEAQPAAEPEADAEEVPVLAAVPRQRLLERGIEVSFSVRGQLSVVSCHWSNHQSLMERPDLDN